MVTDLCFFRRLPSSPDNNRFSLPVRRSGGLIDSCLGRTGNAPIVGDGQPAFWWPKLPLAAVDVAAVEWDRWILLGEDVPDSSRCDIEVCQSSLLPVVGLGCGATRFFDEPAVLGIAEVAGVSLGTTSQTLLALDGHLLRHTPIAHGQSEI